MGFFDKMINKKEQPVPDAITAQPGPLTICAPFNGKVMPLEQIPDPVFSDGVLGPGCGIDPGEEVVYAPFDGVVRQTTDTKHAVGVTSRDGIELLIHVGMDTVDMNGKGFNCLVKKDQDVKAGQPLMTFTLADIKAAGHSAVTAVIVTNADAFSGVELIVNGDVMHGTALMNIKK